MFQSLIETMNTSLRNNPHQFLFVVSIPHRNDEYEELIEDDEDSELGFNPS